MQLPPPPVKRPTSIGQTATLWVLGHRVLSLAVAVFLVAAVVNSLGNGSDIPSRAVESPSPTITPEPTITPDPVIPTTKVPRVIGLSLKQARQYATARSLDISIVRKYSNEPAGTVLRQALRAGERVDEGTSIQLVIARPFPHVPGLAGQKANGAKQELRKAGFTVVVQLQESSTAAGTVLYSIPAAGSQVKPGAAITIIVAKAPPPPPPAPLAQTSDCHPSYTGACLDPNASDYDCAGGSGDGPKYTGFVRVVGYDEYGLDSDNDGLGCES